MMHTYVSQSSTCQRNGLKDSTGVYEKKIIERPTIIEWCNKGMGGTDVFDQMLSYYRTSVKTKRWPNAIIFHILLACAVNAWVLYKLHNNLKQHDNCGDFSTFVNELITMLCPVTVFTPESVHEEQMDDSDSSSSLKLAPKHRRKSIVDLQDHRFKGIHDVCALPSLDSNGHRISKHCKAPHCTRKTSTLCIQCGVHLCIAYSENSTCFKRYHSHNSYT